MLLIASGLDTIDASAFDRWLRFNHDYVFSVEEVMRDLKKQYLENRQASDRGLAERERDKQRYWVIEPN
jgi:hypothetical protein